MICKRTNPFRISFIRCSLIVCVFLSIAFLYVLNARSYELEGQYYQEKVDSVLDDFEFQMQVFEKIALRISINNTYQPFQLAKQKYSENELLNDFVQYQHYSVLTDDLFIYYNNNKNLFHVMGKTIDMGVYMKKLTENEKFNLMEGLNGLGGKQDILLCGEEIYVLTPINIYDIDKKVKAVLVGVIETNALLERWKNVSGGLEGSITLYKDEEIFCRAGESTNKRGRNVYETKDSEKGFKLSYQPDKRMYFSMERLLIYIVLIVTDLLLVIAIADLFARKAYKPLRQISEKYRNKNVLSDSLVSDNAFEEIENMLDFSLQNCVATAQSLEKQKELLKSQVLRMILNGGYLLDVQQYLEKLNIVIPGPFFFVMSILMPRQALNDMVLSRIQKELEEFTSIEENEYLYVLYDQEQKQFWVICSYADADKEKEITECVTETVESFAEGSCVGVGQVYGSFEKISVSWLESMDDLSNKMNSNKTDSQEFIFDVESLHCIMDALSRGAKEEALEELACYTAYLKEKQHSLLMRQYIFIEFIGEVSLLCKKHMVEVSSRNLSLIIASRSIDSFKEAAHALICEFCENYAVMQEKKIREDSEIICRYVKEHCAEYDLSVGKVAAELGMTNSIVRDSVYDATGKNFHDYIVFLRVEYAKKLLVDEKLPVYEVGERVGYSSVSHFIKIFKEETGQTPAKYVRDNTIRRS